MPDMISRQTRANSAGDALSTTALLATSERVAAGEQRAIEHVERIGVEYCRPPPFEHCGEAFAGVLVASEAGPYQEGGAPFVVDRPRKVALLDYQFGGGVGMGMFAQQLYIPCPAAHRGFGGQQRCARHCARNHGQ